MSDDTLEAFLNYPSLDNSRLPNPGGRPVTVRDYPTKLQVILDRRNISLSHFARVVGVSPALVSLWVHGHRDISFRHVFSIARVLRVNPCDFIGFVQPRDQKVG